jgi:hypothetical protein
MSFGSGRLILLIVAGCGASQAQPASEVQPLPTLRTAPAATSTSDGCVAIIPNTDVCDSPRNRTVIDFCERYRHALEARDADALLALASPRYSFNPRTGLGVG